MTPAEYDRAIVTISKDKLATLPVAEYRGKLKVIDSLSQIEGAVSDLNKAKIIGFDTETRPSFKKGMYYNVALIQLATKECCYLFRTNIIGYPKELIEILDNPDILKVGLSIHDDFHSLRKVTEIDPQGFIDLQTFVKDYRIADNSLSRVYGILFGERISKSQRLTNWEASELSDAQQAYAALDASSCIKIYDYLTQGKFNPEKSKYLTVPPEPVEEKICEADEIEPSAEEKTNK